MDNKPNTVRPKKAPVFVWPTLTQETCDEVEADCVRAGYTSKRKVRVGKVICYEVT
jgi:hypothetical protein